MVGSSNSMKDVVAELRRDPTGALLDLFELDVAVGELALSGAALCVAVRELAREARHMAESSGALAPDKLVAFAASASNTSASAEAHARALAEVQRGLSEWSIVS